MSYAMEENMQTNSDKKIHITMQFIGTLREREENTPSFRELSRPENHVD